MSEVYFTMPTWRGQVEVPYGFHDEMSLLGAYLNLSYLNLAHLDGDTEVALRSESTFSDVRHLFYEAPSGRLWWLPIPVREDITAFPLTAPTISMDDWERRETRQPRELLSPMDMFQWSALPHDGMFPELPATPSWRICVAQNSIKVEGLLL